MVIQYFLDIRSSIGDRLSCKLTDTAQLSWASLDSMLSHILSNIRLDSVDGHQVLRVCEVQSRLVKLWLRHKLSQIDLLWLDVPQTVTARLIHLAVDEGH